MQFFRCQKTDQEACGLPIGPMPRQKARKQPRERCATWEMWAAPRRRTADEDAAGCRCRPSLEANESSGLGVWRLSLVTADAECRCGSGTNAQRVSQLLLQQSNSRRAQADGGIEAFLFAAAVVSRPQAEKLTRSRSSSFALPLRMPPPGPRLPPLLLLLLLGAACSCGLTVTGAGEGGSCEFSVARGSELYSFDLAAPTPAHRHGVLSEDGYVA